MALPVVCSKRPKMHPLIRIFLLFVPLYSIAFPVQASEKAVLTRIVFSEIIAQPLSDGKQWHYSNGDIYQGQWENNLPQGQGRYSTPRGDEYQGQFHKGLFQGEGHLRFANGDVYKGHWKNGLMDGKGEIIYQNGNRYDGDWKAGLRHGKGTLKYRSGSFYKGNWVQDAKSGKGLTQYRNGQRYVGDYLNNKPHGYGVQVVDGETYRGTFSRGVRHGAGECNRNGGAVRVCLFDRGNEITDPAKLELAAAYLKKQAPVFEFRGGLAYQMEDEFTKARFQVVSPDTWWEKTHAMLADQLRIRSQDKHQFLYLIVNNYKGPGTYHLQKGEVMAATRSGALMELADGATARIEISSDTNDEITGHFNVSKMQDDSTPTRFFRLYDGQFQAHKKAEAVTVNPVIKPIKETPKPVTKPAGRQSLF